MGRSFYCGWIVVLVLGCQSPPVPGASCSRTSECASPLTCAFGRCRAACVENRDCPSGASCLPSPTGNVCTVETDLGCESGVGRMCPSGLVCVADRCAATCMTNAQCPRDGECRPGPTLGVSFCYDARLPQSDAGGSIDAGGPIDAAMNDALTPNDAAVDAAMASDAATSGCTAVCVQGGDEGAVGERACALCGGAVWCWGYDGDDGLGDGSMRMPEGPPRMVLDGSGAQLTQMRSLACGAQHACAVDDRGRLLCWGGDASDHRALGDVGGSDHARLAGAASGLAPIGAVIAGQYHTCVTYGLSHQLACFGENVQGQVDPTQTTYVVANPAPSTSHPISMASMPFGAAVVDLFGAGLGRTCTVTTTGSTTGILCVGLAEDGNAGGIAELHTATALTTDAIDVGGTPTAIAFGITHECFIRAGQVFCVGGDDFRALGAGTAPSLCGAAMSPCARTPVAVTSAARDFAVIGSGPVSFHTCAAGPTGVSCWGNNSHHQSGAGGSDQPTPTAIPALAAAHVTAIATGVSSSCVIADGAVQCWGWNNHGQLGPGVALNATSATPVHVPIP